MSTTVSMKMRLYALPIDEAKNFVLENLAANLDSAPIAKFPASGYLATTAPANIELETSVRVALPDDAAFTLSLDYTYCRMAYTGSDDVQRDYFYFIKDITREGNNVLRLSLRLDCLNTFYGLWKNAFSDKTRIIRQHEDRFISGDHILAGTLMMKVDPIGEGINPPLYTISKRAIEQDGYDSRWCMRYEKDDLSAEGIDSPLNTATIHTCLFPQQSGASIDYHLSNSFITLADDFSGLYIRTSENITNINPRKSTKVVKEIQCPYCPANLKAGYIPLTEQKAMAVMGFTGQFSNSTVFFHSDIFQEKMASKVTTDQLLTLTVFDTPALSKARKLKDPKLYNSEFHSFVYMYDTYEWSPQIERVIPALYGNLAQPTIYRIDYRIDYYQSSDFVGNLAFRFVLNGGSAYPGSYLYPESYDGLLTCNRNNDHVLFYDEYLEYMKLGYNYDKKTAVSNEVGAWSTFIGGLAATAISAATSNPVGVALGLVATAGGLINAIKTTVDTENSLNRKVDEAKRKGASPTNVGDASLLYGYNENKLWMMEKTISPTMEKMIDDLFYYYGYARGYYGVPNLTSRVYFNFIQCEAVFNSLVLPRFAMTDIAAKLAEGVTVFHHVGAGYDLNQTYENYETALLS